MSQIEAHLSTSNPSHVEKTGPFCPAKILAGLPLEIRMDKHRKAEMNKPVRVTVFTYTLCNPQDTPHQIVFGMTQYPVFIVYLFKPSPIHDSYPVS